MADESVYSIPIDTSGLDSFKKGIGEVGSKVTGILNSWKQSSKQVNDLKVGQKGFTQALEGSTTSAKKLNDEVAKHATLVKTAVGHWASVTGEINKAVDAAKRLNVETGRRPPSAGLYVETGRGPVPEPEGRRRRPPAEDREDKKKTDAGLGAVVDGLKKVTSSFGKSVIAMGGEGAGALGEAASALKGLTKMNIPMMIATGVAAAVTSPAIAAFASAPDVAALKKGRMALGGGVSAGTMRAMRATGGWLPGSGLDTLGNVVSAQRNQVGPEAQAFYQLMGVERGKKLLAGPADAAMFAYAKEAGRVQRAAGPGMQDAIAKRYNMTAIASLAQLRTFDAMGPEGLAEKQRSYEDVRAKTALSSDAENKLDTLNDKMKATGEILEAGIAKNVAFLAPKLGEMAEGVGNFVDHDYAGKLGSVLESLTGNFQKLNEALGGKKAGDKSGTIDFSAKPPEGTGFFGGKPVAPAGTSPEDLARKKHNDAVLKSVSPSAQPSTTPPKKHGWFGRHAEADEPFAPYQTAGLDWQGPPSGNLKHLGSKVGGLLSSNPAASAVGATGNAMLIVRYWPVIRALLQGGGGAALGGIGAAAAVMRPTPAESGELPSRYWPAANTTPGTQTDADLEETKKQTALLTDIKENMDHAAKFGGGLGLGGGTGGRTLGPGGVDITGTGAAGGSGAALVRRASFASHPSLSRRGTGGGGGFVAPASGPTPPASARTGVAMAAAMDQLRKEGVPEEHVKAAAAMLVGQAQMESGLDPTKTHDVDPRTGLPTGYGIYGARNERRTEMLKWMKGQGFEGSSLEGQVRQMAHSAMTDKSYAKTANILKNATPGGFARDTPIMTKNFENPKVVNYRTGAVQQAYGKGPSSAPGTGNAPPAGGAQSGFFGSRVGAGVSGTPGGLNAQFAGDLQASIKEAEAATGEKARFTSLTRDRATQERLYYNYIHHIGGQGLAAKPGTSLHERGMAADLAPGKVRDYIRAHAGAHGMELVPGDPEHVQMAKALRAHASDVRLGQVEAATAVRAAAVGGPGRRPSGPSPHQTGGMQSASNQPLGLHNWQQNRATAFTLHNKTGGDMFVGASLMA